MNAENLLVADREVDQASSGKELVATSRNAHGGHELLQSGRASGTSPAKSRKGNPSITNLQGVKGYEIQQHVPERVSSTTDALPRERLAQAKRVEKSINIPRESVSSQPPPTAQPLANPNHCFRVLDILFDKNEDESKPKPATEPYAAFASKGYGRTDPCTPEQGSPASVPSKRALATSSSKTETLPAVEVAEQDLQISEKKLQIRTNPMERNHSYNSPHVLNASWRLASQKDPKRIASPRLDFMRIQDTIARRPESGNLDFSSQERKRNSPTCFLETSWNVPVAPSPRLISPDGRDTSWSCFQYSPDLEEVVPSLSPDFLEVDNCVQSCQFGTKSRAIAPLPSFEDAIASWAIAEEPIPSFDDAIKSWDLNFQEQDNPVGIFEGGAKGGIAPNEDLLILEDPEPWNILKQVNPAETFELSYRSKERSGEKLASFQELVGYWEPNFLEQNNTVRAFQVGSKARAGSEKCLTNCNDNVRSWESGFPMQDDSSGGFEIGSPAKICSEERFESFDDDGKPWESDLRGLDKPSGSCEVTSVAKTCPEESFESFSDVRSWESDLVQYSDPAGTCSLGSKDKLTSEELLPLFDDVGSWDSCHLSQEYGAGTCETCFEPKEERLSSFGIFVVL
ncbi:unnamed protein product [Calypogeia fissa]